MQIPPVKVAEDFPSWWKAPPFLPRLKIKTSTKQPCRPESTAHQKGFPPLQLPFGFVWNYGVQNLVVNHHFPCRIASALGLFMFGVDPWHVIIVMYKGEGIHIIPKAERNFESKDISEGFPQGPGTFLGLALGDRPTHVARGYGTTQKSWFHQWNCHCATPPILRQNLEQGSPTIRAPMHVLFISGNMETPEWSIWQCCNIYMYPPLIQYIYWTWPVEIVDLPIKIYQNEDFR